MDLINNNDIEDVIFEFCHEINHLISKDDDSSARNKLILLLDFHKKNNLNYNPIVNHLIRTLGLYPYIKTETSQWQDAFVYEIFKVDVGLSEPITLHREQSIVLKKLLEGKSLAISAPTSFGKSFIIDAFISLKKPDNVLIIVPTISLTDETRRRLHKKFSNEYKIITTSDVELDKKNLFIFPQERAISYINKIKNLDLLIIDEFYKASESHDKDRAPALLKAMMMYRKVAKQCYYLAPNINEIRKNPFTNNMEFMKIDFNTVYLERHDFSAQINENEDIKSKFLLDILFNNKGKSLIYAGTYSNIEKVSRIIFDNYPLTKKELLLQFANWLKINYDPEWMLTKLIERESGVHNGRLHRSVSQIQIKLFEEEFGLTKIISTSSIVEGVNTSAENVIIWKSKNGKKNLKDFMFKNIIGRSGRMFKHFIGRVFLLSAPPKEESNDLDLTIPNNLVPDIDEDEFRNEISKEQLASMIAYKEEMQSLLGYETFNRLQAEGAFKTNDPLLIREIALDIAMNPSDWLSITYLNSESPDEWEHFLYKIIKLKPAGWGIEYSKFVSFIKVASLNWHLTIPEILHNLSSSGITIDNFFELERNLTFKLSSILNDVNVLLSEMIPYKNTDISPFIFKTSHAFLPPIVYQLEEYGLPRMISKKLYAPLHIDFMSESLTLHSVIIKLKDCNTMLGIANSINANNIERYIIDHFIDGVSISEK
ncbi:DEAD/DEAH box helicase [Pectobacterium aroidearum]|uniref:DEAD/DEAH box helicase n=2 Tax=Pectobacterium aroidearum TaxID=1201031 RepID=UPI0015F032E1|nr:DEAD/DEAH box helicase [Pectobacterium aroidearum]MBA5235794.1 DEAD/DEAH box helicase [Pectobacterium aroidearum]